MDSNQSQDVLSAVESGNLEQLSSMFPEKTAEQIQKEEFVKTHTEGVGSLEYTEEEKAAAKFTYLLPLVKRAGKSMSQKGIARVLHRLAEFPMGSTTDVAKMGFRSDEERTLFKVLFEISSAKSIIMAAVAKEQAEINAIQNETTTPETGNEENTNG